jgi:uncharacterized protein (DUF2141 family)
MRYLTTLLLGICCGASPIWGQTVGALNVELRGFRSQEGQVWVRVFQGEDGFPTAGEQAVRTENVRVRGADMTLRFEGLAFTDYGISVHHDENDNGEFDMTWLFQPEEGYGASNDAEPSMGPPSYDDAQFDFSRDGQRVIINLKYD